MRGGGYPDDSFYLIDLPKELLDLFSIRSWNDFLCGDFFPFAFPNVNDLTSIETKDGITSVTYNEKFYAFTAIPDDAFIVQTAIDSFSISIPGNLNYNNEYPISKIYPNSYVDSFELSLVQNNEVLTGWIDAILQLSKIKDFEKRREILNELKSQDLASLIDDVEEFNKALEEFDHSKETSQNNDIYKTIHEYLETMDEKFSHTKAFMTPTSQTFAEAIHILYRDFEKETRLYLKKLKTTKNKKTEENLAEYSKQTLEKAILTIQRGIDQLGQSPNRSDRQIGFLLNDYETKFSEYLEKINSGNHGPLKLINTALAKILATESYVLDLSGTGITFKRNKIAKENGNEQIDLDDLTSIILYGGINLKDGKDYSLLVRAQTEYAERLNRIIFDKDSKVLLWSLVGTGYFRSNYLPPIQVIYSGDANQFHLFGENSDLLNETQFPASKQLSSSEGLILREKLKCVFQALNGDMAQFKKLAAARKSSIGSGTLIEKNKSFESLSCSDGKITNPQQ